MHGKTDIIHNQSLRKHSYKNQRLKIQTMTKIDDYFTICHYKTEEPKNIETSPRLSIEV